MAKIFSISAFKDNYIWAWFESTNSAWVVDPGDATRVLEVLNKHQCTLEGILITHHHPDHTGGVEELLTHWPNARVLGSHQSQIPFISEPLRENAEVTCGSQRFKILEIPGHTIDHVAFYNSEFLFCGDTLFSAGCGRVFEGTSLQMYQSLNKLKALSDSTQVYCAHEYTVGNLEFAQRVEPANAAVGFKMKDAMRLRAKLLPTLPAILGQEKLYNPFLRCDQVSVKLAVEQYLNQTIDTEVETFTELRKWKNNL